MADLHDQMAGRPFRQLRGQRFPFLFEFVELHLEQLLMLQGLVNALNEQRAQAGFANFEGGLEVLSGGTKPAQFRIRQAWGHESGWFVWFSARPTSGRSAHSRSG